MRIPWWRWNGINPLPQRIACFGWSGRPGRVICRLPGKLLSLHWIQIISAQGFLSQMVGVPFACRATFARGQLSYPNKSKLFLHQTHLSLMLGSRCLRVVVGPNWHLLVRRWLCRPLGRHPYLASYVGWNWSVPLRMLHKATFDFSIWNCSFHLRGLRECSWWRL